MTNVRAGPMGAAKTDFAAGAAQMAALEEFIVSIDPSPGAGGHELAPTA